MGGFEIGASQHKDVTGTIEEPQQNNGTMLGTEEVNRTKTQPLRIPIGVVNQDRSLVREN